MGLAKASGTAEKHVSGLRKSLGGVWRITGGILLFNVIRHITHSLRDLISTTMDFETQMYNVNSVAQLSTEELSSLNDQVLQLALDPRIKDGPAALAAGLYEIVSAGYSTADAMVLMETAAIAATAGMTTTDTAARVLTATLGSYGMGVEHAKDISDQLFQIVNISRYTFEDLAGSLDSVLPTAAALGIGINEVGAAMAVMASKGVDADTATVQLNGILSALLKPSDAMIEALHSMGYESGQAMLDTLGFVGTMKKLSEVVGEDEAKAAALFGDVRALRGEMNLTNDGGVALTANLEKMGEATDGVGSTTKALNEQMKANSFQLAVLRKNVQVLAVMGFGMLAPYLNKALTGINEFVVGAIKGFQHFRDKGYGIFHALRASLKNIIADMFGVEASKKVLEFYDTFVEVFYGIRDIVTSVFSKVKTALEFMQKHFDYFGPAIKGAVVALIALKIALIGVAVVTAIIESEMLPLIALFAIVAIAAGLLYLAWDKNFLGIQTATEATIKFVGKWIGKIWEFIQPAIDAVVSLGTYWKKIMTHSIEPGNLEGIPGWLQPIAWITGRVVKSLRVFIVTWQKAGAIAAFKKIPMQIRALGRAVANLLDILGLHKVSEIFKNEFYSIADILKNAIDLVDNIIHGRWKKAWGNFLAIVHDVVRMVINRFILIPALIYDVFKMINWGKVGKYIVKGLFWLAGIFEKFDKALLKAGLSLMSWLWAGIVGYWDSDIKPGIKAIPGLMVDFLAAGWSLFFSIGNYLISGFGSGVTAAWNWIVGWFKNLPGSLVNLFALQYNSFYNIGHYVISGLAEGIGSAWNWMVDWLGDQWDRLPSYLKKLWEIASPSKVFADIGANAILGLQQGFQGAMPSLTGTVSMVGAEGVSAATTGFDQSTGTIGMSSVTNSNGNVYNFNVSSNATDPAQVAREVSKVILAEIGRVEAGAA